MAVTCKGGVNGCRFFASWGTAVSEGETAVQAKFVRGVYVPGKGNSALHVLTYQQDREWVCHCLEYDVSGKSPSSQEAAFAEMKRVIEMVLDRVRDAGAIGPAPREYWQAWSSATSSTSSGTDSPARERDYN